MADKWAETLPPPARRGRRGKYDWDQIVRKLKDKPGQWLLIDEAARRGLESSIKSRRMTALQDPNWVFTPQTRNTDREAGTCEVWMRAERT
jgi:hypothetical protein